MTTRDCYRILKVSPGAGWEEVRRRFRALVRECHPDLNPGKPGASRQFRQLVEAYETLRAARARAKKRGRGYYSASFTVQDELFEEFFGIQGQPRSKQTSGPDYRYDLSISFMDSLTGLEAVIEVPQLTACPQCRGTGRASGSEPRQCPDCQGRGRRPLGPGMLRMATACERCQGRGNLVEHQCPACQGLGNLIRPRRYRVKVPAGTESGARLCFVGEGGEGFGNGPRGNLVVVISVAPHAFFSRRGRDVHLKFEVSFAQAALGGEVLVPTKSGFRTLTLPRGTQSGRIFRIPGAGVPASAEGAAGDQVIEVVVNTPAVLSPDQRTLLEEFRRLERPEMSWAAHE